MKIIGAATGFYVLHECFFWVSSAKRADKKNEVLAVAMPRECRQGNAIRRCKAHRFLTGLVTSRCWQILHCDIAIAVCKFKIFPVFRGSGVVNECSANICYR